MKKYFLYIILVACFFNDCRQAYNPPVVKQQSNFLVVDGFINASDSTFITLSRSQNLSSGIIVPEQNADVTVEGESSGSQQLQTIGSGIYAGGLVIHPWEKYRLKVVTINNSVYVSDFEPVKITPDIDSVTYRQDSTDVSILISTHDPDNQTWYYRWEYEETWEYHSVYDSHLGFKNHTIYFKDSSELTTVCWRGDRSSDILLGTSAGFSTDVIDRNQLIKINRLSGKIDVKYSILVNQYALTKNAFLFWQTLKKNGQQGGSILAPQPSQVIGNLHCVTNPNEPVIGYVSISTKKGKRIFIRQSELMHWSPLSGGADCYTKIVPTDPFDSATYLLDRDTSLLPAYYSGGPGAVAISKNFCVDCTKQGGTLTKPSFWK